MRVGMVILGCLIGTVVLFTSYWGPQTPFIAFGNSGYSRAEPKPHPSEGRGKPDKLSSEIGVVSIQKIFQGCRRSTRYREEVIAEQQRVKAELEKLGKEVEAEDAGLRALRPGSSDYMAQMKGLLEKRANYRIRQELYKQQTELRDQLWTKELYQDILQVTSEVAKQRGLNLVFREDEIDFSETSATELGLAIRTHKLLYSGGCLDITDDVMARLDGEKSK